MYKKSRYKNKSQGWWEPVKRGTEEESWRSRLITPLQVLCLTPHGAPQVQFRSDCFVSRSLRGFIRSAFQSSSFSMREGN